MAKPDESHTEVKQERNRLPSIDARVRVSVDSMHELHALSELAEGSERAVDIAFRVNPDVSSFGEAVARMMNLVEQITRLGIDLVDLSRRARNPVSVGDESA